MAGVLLFLPRGLTGGREFSLGRLPEASRTAPAGGSGSPRPLDAQPVPDQAASSRTTAPASSSARPASVLDGRDGDPADDVVGVGLTSGAAIEPRPRWYSRLTWNLLARAARVREQVVMSAAVSRLRQCVLDRVFAP